MWLARLETDGLMSLQSLDCDFLRTKPHLFIDLAWQIPHKNKLLHATQLRSDLCCWSVGELPYSVESYRGGSAADFCSEDGFPL